MVIYNVRLAVGMEGMGSNIHSIYFPEGVDSKDAVVFAYGASLGRDNGCLKDAVGRATRV